MESYFYQLITELYMITGPPKIRSQEIQYGIEGDELLLECNTRSVPAPTIVQWYQDGRVHRWFLLLNNNLVLFRG